MISKPEAWPLFVNERKSPVFLKDFARPGRGPPDDISRMRLLMN